MQVILLLTAFLFSFEKLSSPKRQKWRIEMKNLNEAKAGIMALNVVSDDSFLEINGIKIERKEYKGVPVLTVWDISEVHNREAKTIGQTFSRNRKNLIENEDYFVMKQEEFSGSHFLTQKNIPNNVKEIFLFTQTGYLMLVKSFKDDFSWKIQRSLVQSYFNIQILKKAIRSGEIEIIRKDPKALKKDLMFDVMEAETKEESMAALAKFNREYIKPLEINDARYRKFLDKNGTIRATDIAGLLGTTPAFVNLVMHYAGVIVRDGKGWKPQKEWGGKGIMKLIETSYFVKRPVPDDKAGNAEQKKEEENNQQLSFSNDLQSDGNFLPAVKETGKKEVDKVEFRYTIEGAELIEKIFLESGLVVKDENGNFYENKELAKIMRTEYNNFKKTGKRNFKIDNNIIIFPES